ncbi:hypothetical protein EK21DRAFT_85855 [Setomelanomma holmii]|uniref:Uncharacterized protein n=1 Tax=Setomelanomma holmii TaxID=210430 RepID=A0A9P4HI91_9PLEO|nr:hypothetical protein EK21DRAFT_85855 [Setomelanomma holmii]
MAKFETLKDPTAPASTLRTGLRKVQWSLCEKERVLDFRQRLGSHISALQLHLLIFNVNTQTQIVGKIEEVEDDVDALATKVETALYMQEHITKDVKDVPTQLKEIQQHPQYGLSPDEQHTMFRLREEALAERRALESRMELLIAQNQTLEAILLT